MVQHYNAAVLDPDACLNKLSEMAGAQLTLVQSASAEELINSVVVHEPDVVLLDFETPGLSGLDLARRLREVNPAIPILLLATNPDWSILERVPFIDLVRSPIDPNEVLHRIFRLLQHISQEEVQRFRLPNLIVDELRTDSGRIDAKLVAEMFDISIPQLARIIGAGEPALYKTPDAKSVQAKLVIFERIAWGLLKLTGSVKGLRIWLNASNPELDDEPPIDYIKEGHIEDIAAMVEDVLLGHPI